MHEDVVGEILDAVAASDAHGLLVLSQASRLMRQLVKARLFRVVCVEQGELRDFRISGSPVERERRGFPLVTHDRFADWDAETAGSVRHLHLYGVRLERDAFDKAFRECPLLVSLWLDHDGGLPASPPLRGVEGLHALRELTLPLVYFADRSSELLAMTVPTVTHLHFDPVLPSLRLDVRTLAAFPSLTHVGFSGQTLNGCVERATASLAAVAVVVRTWEPRFWYVHPRVVYLRCRAMPYEHSWLKRACPAWTPPGARGGRVWDQWVLLDAVMRARADGRLLAEDGPMSDRVDDYAEDLQ